MKKLLILCFFLQLGVAKADIEFVSVYNLADWEEMLDLAYASKRNLLVQFTWSNCADCKALRKTTYKDDQLSTWANTQTLSVSLNVETDFGQQMADLYKVDTIPTLLLINPGEIVFYQKGGYVAAAELLPALKKASLLASEYLVWKKDAAAGTLAVENYLKFLWIEYRNNRIDLSNPIVSNLARGLTEATDFANPIVLRFISKMCLSIDNPVFQILRQQPELIPDSLNFNWQSYKANCYAYNVNVAIINEDSVFLEETINQIAKMPRGDSIPHLPFRARQLYTAELGKWAAYDSLVMTRLANISADSADAYQREAIFLMENYEETQPYNLALEYLEKGLKLKKTYALYYTLSLWLFKTGDLSNSYQAAYTAESLAKNAEEQKLARQMQYMIERYY